MNNENLPQIVKDTLLSKFKKWIKRLIRKDENKISDKTITQTNTINEKDFAETIKVEDKTEIINLQKRLKENKIKIAELTDNQLKQMIELYKNQIEQKRLKLKQYRMMINMKGAPK